MANIQNFRIFNDQRCIMASPARSIYYFATSDYVFCCHLIFKNLLIGI